jgi:hypothetical protein
MGLPSDSKAVADALAVAQVHDDESRHGDDQQDEKGIHGPRLPGKS